MGWRPQMRLSKTEDVAMGVVLSARRCSISWRSLGMRLRFVLASVLALWLAGTAPRTAFAHAVPVTSSPAPNAMLSEGPREITVRFSERVEARASSLEVFDARGSRIDAGNAVVDTADPWLYRVTLQPVAAGVYTISWRVMSADDGHVTEGSYVFAVGETASVAPSMPGQTAAVAWWPEPLVRWFGILSAVALLGMLTTPLVFRREGPSRAPRLSMMLPWACAIVVSGGITLFLKAHQISPTHDIWTGLGALMPTAIGRVWAAKIALTVLLVGTLAAYWRARRHRTGLWSLGIVLSLLTLMIDGLVSHSAATVELRSLAVGAQMVHLLGIALWVGGLGYFATLFWWGSHRDRSLVYQLAWALPAFSLLAAAAVGLLTLSGIYLARLHLGSIADLASTAYGRILFAKLAIVALMSALGGYHQFVVHRRILASLNRPPEHGDRVSRRFRWTLRLEALLGLLTLLLAAYLGTTSPPHMAMSTTPEPFRHEREVGEAKLMLEVWPFRPGLNTIRLTLIDRAGQPLRNATAAMLQLQPTQVDVGPVAVTLDLESPGRFVKTGPFLGMEGQWRGRLTVQQAGGYDLHDRFELLLPGNGVQHAHDVSPAPVDAVMGLVTIGIAAMTILLLITSRRKLNRAQRLIEFTRRDPVHHPTKR
jgi:copper transport protein